MGKIVIENVIDIEDYQLRLKIEKIKEAIENANNGVSKLTSEILDLPAFNTHAIKHLLNNLGAISHRYLEVGLHKAGGFISALYENETYGVGIDNWSEFEQNGDSKIIAYENMGKYLNFFKYMVIENDCFAIKDSSLINEFDLYTYDAGHGFEQQYQGIVHFLPYMANEFIFCLDDAEWVSPKMATIKAIIDLKLEVLYSRSLFDGIMGGKWHNGFQVYLLKKSV